MQSTSYSHIIPFNSTINAELNALIETAVQQRTFHYELDELALGYYNWLLFCQDNHISDEHRKYLESSHKQRLSSVAAGFLDLSDEDIQDLQRKLNENAGSRDDVKSLRKWVLERSHSIVAIAREIKNFIKSAVLMNREDTILHTLYTVNDVLYNMKDATSIGPYTSLLPESQPVNVVTLWVPYLAFILRLSFDLSANNASQQNKIRRLLNLWESKGFLGLQYFQIINSCIESSIPPQEPPDYELTRPYLEGLEVFVRPQISYSTISDESNLIQNSVPQTYNSLTSNADFGMLSVGKMVSIIKFHNKSMSMKYSPIDIKSFQCLEDEVESGRIEVRVKEFYRKAGAFTQNSNRKRQREG